MVVTDSNSIFPDQVVPDEVKSSYDYGMQVGKAIEGEWFSGTRTGMGNRYSTNFNNFRNLRLYARGEQAVQKYKDELAIVPVIPKFVDIVVNGMSEKLYEIKAYAQDPQSLKSRTEYANRILRDIETQEYLNNVQETLGLNLYSTENPKDMPQNQEELELHMQLDYKQSVEIAEEELINNTLDRNCY